MCCEIKFKTILTLSETPRPKVTSPDTVKWSSSIRSGMLANRAKNSLTLLKWLSPNFTNGVVGNIRCGDIISEPPFRLYRFDITSNKSDVFLTGKNRERGTLIPMQPSKHFIAAPTAVSSWITRSPVSNVLWFTIVSMFNVLWLSTRSIAAKFKTFLI